MRVLCLTKYTRLGASSRMRSFQYFPYLQQQGITISVSPLFGDDYLTALYSGKKRTGLIIKSYIKRLFVLFTIFKYDRIVIEKELFPYFPAFFEWLLKRLGIKYIVDYDDAIFHIYDQHPNGIFKRMLGTKIDKVMRYSHLVAAGNVYLAARAKNAEARQISIVPTVIDLERYPQKKHTEHHPLIIGWIGTKSTFEKHFLEIKELIKLALERFNIEFHVIGAGTGLDLGDRVKYFSWSEETEVSSILNFDIGIMPLTDSLWEKGKCAYKLIQYMACGLPVIASPVGMNKTVVKHGENGYLASTNEEWLEALERYISDQDLRAAHGQTGRSIVENEYCLQQTKMKVLDLLSS